MKVIITVVERGRIPLLNWKITVETEGTTWEEEVPTRTQRDMFIRGVKAGAASQGEFNVEEVHRKEA